MAEHNELGKWGEQIACDYLISKGYGIRDRNWRLGNKEIDIVAVYGTRIIFVEVKTRAEDYVDPLLAIDKRRINRIVSAAHTYIISQNIPLEPQFDVILIIGVPFGAQPPRIEHIPDAFFAPLRTIR